jgi:hypothetical protein
MFVTTKEITIDNVLYHKGAQVENPTERMKALGLVIEVNKPQTMSVTKNDIKEQLIFEESSNVQVTTDEPHKTDKTDETAEASNAQTAVQKLVQNRAKNTRKRAQTKST